MRSIKTGLLIAVGCLLLVGCGDDDSGSSGLDISGPWDVVILSSQAQGEGSPIIVRFNMQSATGVTAECFTAQDEPCIDTQTFIGAIVGFDLDGQWSYNNQQCVVDWLIEFNGLQGFGTYDVPADQECSADHGTLSLSKRN